MLTRRQFSRLLSAAAAAPVFAPAIVRADEYPSRPVTVICPFAAGGATDIAARLLAEELKKKFDQTFVVENRGGAGGNIGLEAGARAAKDGYTLTVGTMGSLTTNQYLYKDMKFDGEKDFAPISMMFSVDHVLVVNPKFPAKTVQELVAAAKAKPGEITYGSSGAGSSVHMFMVLLEMRTGMKLQHVPYKGSALALNDVVAGHINTLMDTLPSSIGQIEGGNTRPLAVSSSRRAKKLPNVPTMMESGVADFDVASWGSLMAPAGTPDDIVRKLNAAINEAYARPEVVANFADKGADAVGSTPQELSARMKKDAAIWKEVIRVGNVTVN